MNKNLAMGGFLGGPQMQSQGEEKEGSIPTEADWSDAAMNQQMLVATSSWKR